MPNFANIKFDITVSLGKGLSTAESADTANVMGVEIKNTDKTKKVSLDFHFVRRRKKQKTLITLTIWKAQKNQLKLSNKKTNL